MFLIHVLLTHQNLVSKAIWCPTSFWGWVLNLLKSSLPGFEMRCCLLPSINELPSWREVHVWFTIREMWILSGLWCEQDLLSFQDLSGHSPKSWPQPLGPGAFSLAGWTALGLEAISLAGWKAFQSGVISLAGWTVFGARSHLTGWVNTLPARSHLIGWVRQNSGSSFTGNQFDSVQRIGAWKTFLRTTLPTF